MLRDDAGARRWVSEVVRSKACRRREKRLRRRAAARHRSSAARQEGGRDLRQVQSRRSDELQLTTVFGLRDLDEPQSSRTEGP